ncbi:unnamed protein product [Caenorhabditis bovis]|uniref:Sushi domain-containing protein n=1 Tax=Caenorhabditis bovis TaxID=2654633 RepID=A0A8S1F884_9PELO|nr:unnamed protein product [Caenorhabditis bovis]
MSTPANGNLEYSVDGGGPYPSGTTVSLKCNANFKSSSGSTNATCQNGVWSSPSLATCQKADSKAAIGGGGVGGGSSCLFGIAPVINANLVYSNNAAVGPYPMETVVTAVCTGGTVPSGGMTASCQNGNWVPSTLGTCRTIGSVPTPGSSLQCGRLGDPLGGSLVYSSLGFGPYPSGSSVSLVCNLGYTLSGSAVSICTNGVWTPLPGTCTMNILRKPAAAPPTNTSIPQQKAVGIIMSNATLYDSPKDGASIESCLPPIAPSFGEITLSSTSTNHSYPEGTTAALKCNFGYKSRGPTFSTCRKGSFRPILGKCSNETDEKPAGICVPLSPPRNARIVYIQSGPSLDFEDGTTALLYCEEGYAVTGSATLQCQGGQWEPASGFGMCDAI